MTSIAARGHSAGPAPVPGLKGRLRRILRPAYAIPLLLVLAMAMALLGRLTGLGVLRMPDAEVLQYRELKVLDGPDGSISILDASNGTSIVHFGPGGGGFIRAVLGHRPRERNPDGSLHERAFRLTSHADGKLVLEDRIGGTRYVLTSFGRTNAEAFAKLLPQ
jgi:putative photosynthetic complex assembly protein